MSQIDGRTGERREPAPRRGRPVPEPVRVKIEGLAFGGEGIGRLDGKVCFVPGALPGEVVEAVRGNSRRNWDRMQLLRVLEPSPRRRTPLCPHLGVCGGCSLQALVYEDQLAAKAQQVRDCLARIGRMEVPEAGPALPSPAISGYRNKMEFTFSPRAWIPEGPPETPGPGPALGLHVPGRFDAVFDLEACALTSGAAVRALHLIRAFARERGIQAWRSDTDLGTLRHLVVREGKNTGELLLALVVRARHPALAELGPILRSAIPSLVGFVVLLNTKPATVARGEEEDIVFGRPFLRERLCGRIFEIQPHSFFQTNTWGAEVLASALRTMAEGSPRTGLLDLYCGAGTLGIVLSDLFDSVLGVESIGAAVDDARHNAALNGITNARFLEGNVEDWLVRGEEQGRRYPVVVVDPPRAGLHPRALRGLIALAPERILYVSCNPSTLARDASALRDEGYRPERLQVVDMFPHTAHVESILLLDRE